MIRVEYNHIYIYTYFLISRVGFLFFEIQEILLQDDMPNVLWGGARGATDVCPAHRDIGCRWSVLGAGVPDGGSAVSIGFQIRENHNIT